MDTKLTNEIISEIIDHVRINDVPHPTFSLSFAIELCGLDWLESYPILIEHFFDSIEGEYRNPTCRLGHYFRQMGFKVSDLRDWISYGMAYEDAIFLWRHYDVISDMDLHKLMHIIWETYQHDNISIRVY